MLERKEWQDDNRTKTLYSIKGSQKNLDCKNMAFFFIQTNKQTKVKEVLGDRRLRATKPRNSIFSK